MSTSPFFSAARAALWACIALGTWAGPAPARAGLTVAGSAGIGMEVAPERSLQGGNLMGAVGYELFGILRPELGVLGAIESARGGGADGGLELRPMLVLHPPLSPLYLRGVLSAVDLFSAQRRALAYGGALGVQLGVFGINLFGEAGALPRAVAGHFTWVLEARLGVLIRLT